MKNIKIERVDRNHHYFVRIFFDDWHDLFDRVLSSLPFFSNLKLYRQTSLPCFATSREPFVIAAVISASFAPRSLACSRACFVNRIVFIAGRYSR